MKILITGGYGFIGSHVAERFYKEGHKVFIIDNMSSGNARNVYIKHTAYKINVEDKKCDEIFRSNKFDIVIHLAAQINVTNSLVNPYEDTESNVLGLVNMLELSARYKVKKFIFSSSAAVYGDNELIPISEKTETNPLSPYGLSKLLGEQYCSKWTQIYGLETVCFRFSNVYGPRQGLVGEGGVISIFMGKLINNEALTIYGDGSQTRDFIYVTDVVDAIYRAAESYVTGIYNLSTNSQSRINNIIDILKGFQPVKQVIYKEVRKGDIKHSSLDNSKVKKALDWVPLYDLEAGLKLTYKWFLQNNENKQSAVKTNKVKPLKGNSLKAMLPYIENLALFSIIFFLSKTLRLDSVIKVVDLKLVYVVLIGITYGTKQSIIAVLLACGLFTSESLTIGSDMLSLLLDTSYILQLSSYFILGTVIGYSVDKRERLRESDKHKLEAVMEKYDFLQELYNDTYLSKSELENQVVNSEDSFGRIYGIIKELDSLEPQLVYKYSVDVLGKILKTDEISIYTVDNSKQYIRLAIKSNKEGFIPKITLAIDSLGMAKDIIFKGGIFVNKQMDAELPTMIAPVIQDGNLLCVIFLHDVQFERLNLYYENLFKVVTNLISDSIINAYKFEKATSEGKHVSNTMLLNEESFKDMLDIKSEVKKENRGDYSVICVTKNETDYKVLSEVLGSSIRENDYAGMSEEGRVCMILSNSSEKDSIIVADRLKELGFEIEKFEKDDAHV